MSGPASRISARLCHLPAAACALALLLAGCGGGGATETATTPGAGAAETTKEEYEQQVTEALEPVISESQELANQAPSAESVEDLAPQLQSAATTYETAAGQLAEISPPADVADLHERLVKANQELADATAEAHEAAEKGDRKRLEPYADAGQDYQETLTKLQGELEAKGYEFGAGTAAATTTTAPTPPPPTTPPPSTTPPELPKDFPGPGGAPKPPND